MSSIQLNKTIWYWRVSGCVRNYSTGQIASFVMESMSAIKESTNSSGKLSTSITSTDLYCTECLPC